MQIGKWFTLNIMYKFVVHWVSLEKVCKLLFRLHLRAEIISDPEEPKLIHETIFSMAIIPSFFLFNDSFTSSDYVTSTDWMIIYDASFCLFKGALRIAGCIASNNRRIVNHELESLWVEEFGAQFEAVSQHLAGVAHKTTKRSSQNSQYPPPPSIRTGEWILNRNGCGRKLL
jgi:hypothetical protein